MASKNRYKDLNEFLSKHNAKSVEKREGVTSSITHTRIPDQVLNIYGGSYVIPTEEYPTFYNLYHESVFVNKKMEYLTEKQIDRSRGEGTNGGICIDIDLRYHHDVTTRQHTKEHVIDLINLLYLEELKNFFTFEANKSFPIYIFEKPTVNRLADGTLTKDGIHIIIGIQTDHILQTMLRDKIVSKIGEYWDLPILNDWNSVFDEGISKGTTNWQMFGSRKPGNQAYELVYYFVAEFDSGENQLIVNEKNANEIDLSKDLFKLSAQYDNHVSFELNSSIKTEYENKCKTINNKKTKRITSKNKINLLVVGNNIDENDDISLNEIDSSEKLNRAVNQIMNSLKSNEIHIKEVHEYTQILPEKYWTPGSHALNRQVGFALKHTDERLFLSWVMLRSKAEDFDYYTIPDLHNQWSKYFKDRLNGVTMRSIIYWAKQDAPDEYERIKKSTLDYYVEQTIDSSTEFDFALVLKHMYKDMYLCSSLVNKSWYVFKDHRWVLDKGQTLRMRISVEMYAVYTAKLDELNNRMAEFEAGDERYTTIAKRSGTLGKAMEHLKRTNDKNNILREACELFFDPDFEKNMDSNKWLLCFKNGVVDIKNKIFRNGYPQDYITKSTNILYNEYNEERDGHKIQEINSFMEQLFPVKSLNSYMWQHLASVLIGENINQTFNIYRGSGSNGKSILTDLMVQTLGDYTGTVPITLVTEKRVNIGGTSSEVMQLKGVRYAVMQEPSKDARINEGMMKQLTGDSTLSGRALYCETETFAIQFHLVVCTNTLFEIMSNDDGTWRRIRICDFMSKFTDENTNAAQLVNNPYQFPKDKGLKDKLPDWATVFASMLVKLAFENQGIVQDCDTVKASSNNYREGQDHISAFVNEMITIKVGKHVKQSELSNEFKKWFEETQGTKKKPKGIELYEYMDQKFGKMKKGYGWSNVEIIYPTNDPFDQDENSV